MPAIPIPITVTVRANGVDVIPTYANVANLPLVDVKLVWILTNTTFAENCFEWKDDPEGAPAVECPEPESSVLESAVYKNDFEEQRVWAYKIRVLDPNHSDTVITIDPEVNNEPPGT